MSTQAPETIVRYEPRGAVRELFSSRAGEIVIAGPAGTGKSLGCLFRLHFAAMRVPRARCLILRKVAATLGSTTLVTFEEKVAAAAIEQGSVKWFGGSTRKAACYNYSNKSVIVVGGLDKPEKIMSSEYDLVFVDEATEITITDWENIGTRLRNGRLPRQQQIAACNPAGPSHWLKLRADEGAAVMLNSRHTDNPKYTNADGSLTEAGKAYIEGKLAKLTGVRRLRLEKGIWAAAEGLVYEDFDENIHIVDGLPKGSEQWTRWWTVDFGYNNPFVCQFWAEDPDGGLWLYREIYRTKRLVEDHALDILATVRQAKPGLKREADPKNPADWVWTEPRPRGVICDHDAEDRATLERHLGMGTQPAHKTVKDGIEATQSRFKVDENGKTRIHFVAGALVYRDPLLMADKKPCCTLEEVGGYVWPSGVKPDQRDRPVKEDDHGMDGMRYIVAERDLHGTPRYRSFRR